MKLGNIKLNESSRIIFAKTNAEIPTNFGRGGMKKLYKLQFPGKSMVGSSRNITFDDDYGSIGKDSVRVTTIDYENGIVTEEIIDADVAEKRKRQDLDKTRHLRRRIHDEPIIVSPIPPSTAVPPVVPAVSAPEAPIVDQGPTMPSSRRLD
jgi:hypothetical protein